ncbi:hypothetical protein [Neolewinella agarilytica]|uniref:Outer membrane protein beta-barrel domain-containing protein n=1 Tax=Neolewinella agarilytica TaxID=478744 RepID=A0A1H9GD59_9BACT|nr:hypothetical protein [Neolewinella agarilytica]SEQ48041.1 hypothetical protein SAMN05444359_110134 [Neolewinella agarilytica]
MKFLVLIILLSLSFTCQAQLSIENINLQAGATLMDWDGLYRRIPGSYTRRSGYFGGITLRIKPNQAQRGFLNIALKYRQTHTDRTTNFERFKLDEIAASIGIGSSWKKIYFSLNGSAIFIIQKMKISNFPNQGSDINSVENFYASLSGKIGFNLTPRLSIVTEQALLNTKIYTNYWVQRGERFEVPRYPNWTLLGLSYAISKRE